MRGSILVYQCPHDSSHSIPGDDTRLLKTGDGGFIVACNCGPESLDEADSKPHESVDHLVNIYYDDPSPEDWLALEDAADSWYEVDPWEPVTDEGRTGTHKQRRETFRRKVTAAAETDRPGFESRRNDPENRSARTVGCPNCGAGEDQQCQRPSGHTVQKVHAARKEAAQEAGVLEADTEQGQPADLEQATIVGGRWGR